MKKKNWIFKIMLLLVTSVFIMSSCEDKEEPINPEPPIVSDTTSTSFGWIPLPDEEWEKLLPELEDVSQLGWDDNTSYKQRSLPRKHMLEVPYVYNQYEHNNCVAMALAASLSIVNQKISGMSYESEFYSREAMVFSPAYITALVDNSYWIDSAIKDGIQDDKAFSIIKNYGVCTEADFPYPCKGCPVDPLKTKPANSLIRKGIFNGSEYSHNFYRVKGFDSTPGDTYLEKYKNIIYSGSPISTGIVVPTKKGEKHLKAGKQIIDKATWESLAANRDGYGFHRIVIIGYDEDRKAFLALNSWGTDFGGMDDQTPKGCFWIGYDLIGVVAEDVWGYIDGYALISPYTIGVKQSKPAKTSKIYEFNGFQGYKDVNYSDQGVTFGKDGLFDIWGWAPFANFATAKIEEKGYIEYPMNTIIPSEGTIEIDVYPKEFYQEVYNSIDLSQISSTNNHSGAPIFSTLITMQAESKVGQTESSIGALELRVNQNGHLVVRIAEKEFDKTVEELASDITSSGTNLLFFNASNKVKMNDWNSIGLSIGSEGLKINLNGVVTETNCKIKLSANQLDKFTNKTKPFTIGYATARNDRWWYTSGEITVTGTNKLYREGFKGYIKAFRTSDEQSDWVLCK